LETALLRDLDFVVRAPVLRVRRTLRYGVGVDLRRLAAVVTGADQAGGDHMLAGLLSGRLAPELKIFTGTGERIASQDDAVSAVTGLRGNQPNALFEDDPTPRCDLQSFELPHVHGIISQHQSRKPMCTTGIYHKAPELDKVSRIYYE
jgi:hypothetical protein